jgi:hypothetical protein
MIPYNRSSCSIDVIVGKGATRNDTGFEDLGEKFPAS